MNRGRRAAERSFLAALIVACLVAPSPSNAEPVAVAHLEGLAHGFVSLRDTEGKLVAEGDLIQNAVETSSGHRVTARLLFRFKDGSVRDETTVYLQRDHFRLVSNHVVQKGPTFKKPMESNIDVETGRFTVRYTEDGKEKTIDERIDMPDDLANGMMLALLKNIPRKSSKTTVSMLAVTPEPRLVKLEFIPDGDEPFFTAGHAYKAMKYAMKVNIPGLTGTLASLLGKTPPDSHFWVLGGDAPAFIKAETQLFTDGPVWRIELVSPVFSSEASAANKQSAKKRPAAAARDATRIPRSQKR